MIVIIIIIIIIIIVIIIIIIIITVIIKTKKKPATTKLCIGGDEAKYERYNGTPLSQQTTERTVSSSKNANNALDQSPPTMSEVCATTITNNHGSTNSPTRYTDTIA